MWKLNGRENSLRQNKTLFLRTMSKFCTLHNFCFTTACKFWHRAKSLLILCIIFSFVLRENSTEHTDIYIKYMYTYSFHNLLHLINIIYGAHSTREFFPVGISTHKDLSTNIIIKFYVTFALAMNSQKILFALARGWN